MMVSGDQHLASKGASPKSRYRRGLKYCVTLESIVSTSQKQNLDWRPHPSVFKLEQQVHFRIVYPIASLFIFTSLKLVGFFVRIFSNLLP
uniref:Uncharacterized protein n=1 Tax=Rhizophora mucronata TaxID=61149 RepID=A0A2P2QWN0_RHIMU